MLSVPGARSKNDVERQETTGVQNPANTRPL